MSEPWLSVVMPTYNGERYLRETFESLVAQDERGFECVVVDGGSTDATREIIDTYARQLNVRIFVQPEFPNWVGKTNFAFEQARAPHVCMLHHDDAWLPGRAAAIRDALNRHPEVALVLHASRMIDEAGHPLGRWSCPLAPEPTVHESSRVLEHLLVQNFIACPSPTFRRDAALGVGGISGELWYTGDWDFYLKLAATGPAIYLDRELSAYRLHGSSLTISASANIAEFRGQLDSVLARHIDRIPDPIRRRRVKRTAEASNAVNAALAASLHGGYSALPRALAALARLGPAGLHRYLVDSRIAERVCARWRARRLLVTS